MKRYKNKDLHSHIFSTLKEMLRSAQYHEIQYRQVLLDVIVVQWMIYLLWIIYWLDQGMILMSNIAVCILKTQIQFLKYCCWLSKKQPSVADIEYKRELGVAVSLIHFFKTLIMA